MENKFFWGDAVVVKKDAPTEFHPSAFASVCGMDQILTESDAVKLKCTIGDWVYTIEFQDGSSIEIAECYLEKYKNN